MQCRSEVADLRCLQLAEYKANFDLASQMYWLHVASLTLDTYKNAQSSTLLQCVIVCHPQLMCLAQHFHSLM